MRKTIRKSVSLTLTVLMMFGMLSAVVMPAHAAGVFIIDPDGTDGASGSLGGVSGTVYTSYGAFEAAYTGTDTVDVYFTAGTYGGITVSRSVRLYGAKHGIDPNAHGADILSEWTLAPGRGTGETVFTGQVRVTTTGTRGVTVDGVTLDGDAAFKIETSTQALDIVLENIVVGENFTGETYFLNASPVVNTVPAAGNYPMNFTISNVYAGNYAGIGKWFLYFIAAKEVTLDNIYFSNTDTMFIETSAASRNGNEFVMKNCFLYNNLTSWSGTQATVYHRFPSIGMTESVSFENNVFFNAHGYNQGATSNNVTIMLPEIKNLTQYYNFYGNVFVSTQGCKAAVRNVSSNTLSSGTFDAANVIVKENAFVGYHRSLNSYDGNNQATTGKIDMSDNFSYYVAAIGTGEDITTEEQLNALTGVAPQVIQRGLLCDVTGPYYLNFARTISTDMCRVTGIDLQDAVVDGTAISGISTQTPYVPSLIYTCGNDIARAVTLKDAGGQTIPAITAAGTYTMTVAYESQSRDFTLTVEIATPYTGSGYMFDPAAQTEVVAHFWDGEALTFTMGEDLFTTIDALKAKAAADGVAVPDILIPAGTIEERVEITFSCNILGVKHGVDPCARVAAETQPWTLSPERGAGESVFAGEVLFGIPVGGMEVTVDGVALQGDGRFRDNVAGRQADFLFKNIYVFPGQMSSAAGTNARFTNSAYSIKSLTYENIYIDGAAANSANSTKQMFLTFGKDVTFRGVYYANTTLPFIPNVMLHSHTDLTADLSFTMEDCRFYNCNTQDGAFLASYYGDETHAYLRYEQRENVDYTFRNNVFFNCANATTGGNNYHMCAVINVRYPYPSFHYLFEGNSFIDTRPTAAFIENNPGTDVYSCFLHMFFKNNKKNEANYGVSLQERVILRNNRFIGEQAVINTALPSVATLPLADGNYVLSAAAVEAMSDPAADILTAAGENPYDTINTAGYRPNNYYIDYAMTTLNTAAAPAIGTVTGLDRTVELVRESGALAASEFAPNGMTAALKQNGSPVETVSIASLSAGTHVYTLDITSAAGTVTYTLLLHTATTDDVYPDASLLAPVLENVADGHDYYAAMNGDLLKFTTGETAFGNIDRIARYTQTETPAVLLPAGTYTDEQLSPKVSVHYIYDENAVFNSGVTVRSGKIRVACVGDSVTLGTGATNRALYAYPAVLQNTLGDDYEVVNFGRGGALASDSVAFPYRQTYNYNKSLEFEPDVVIIAIGVNDMQSGYYGTALDYLAEEYPEFIDGYQRLDSRPIVYLASVHNVQSGWPTDYLDALYDIQRQAARDAGVGFIDERTLGARWNDASYFSDNVHPNNAGYVQLAADYYGSIDWTETGAHLPTEPQTVTFTEYGLSEIPPLFDLTVEEMTIAPMESGDRYSAFARFRLAATEAFAADPTLDVKVLEYGALYSTDAGVLNDYIARVKAGVDTAGLSVRQYAYAASETGLDRIYEKFSYRFSNIKPGRTRAAAAYIRYEAGGRIYTGFSAVASAASSRDG